VTTTTTTARIDVANVAPAGVQTCAIDVIAPEVLPAGRRPVVAVCLPGGYSSRRYFDLDVPAALGGYSMARHLAERGLVVVTVDPPGVGASDVPDDPFTLTPDTLGDVAAAVTAAVLAGLTAGTLVPDLAPLADPLPLGIGHSAGALLTVYEQARHRPFAALALLGFAGRGLLDFLDDDERACADDPVATRATLARLVAARFGSARPPYPEQTTSIFSGGPEPEAVKEAVRATRSPLLALLGLTSMIPGASAPELATIDVPVFLGVGDADITGDPRAIPGHFPNATDITLFVLARSGHAHNIAATRTDLWDRLTTWVDGLV